MLTTENVKYGKYPEELLDVYAPDTPSDTAFLYFHGGGLDHGDKTDGYAPVAEYLTARGVTYISANYRMYPTAKFPDFLTDAADAVAWAKEYAEKNLVGKKALFVGGSSAGGYMSMMLCFDERYLAAVGLSNRDIAGYVHDAGQPTAHFNVLRERGIDTRRVIVDETAPLYFIDADKYYPPMRFIVSDNDMRCRYEQTMLILATLSHFGYESFDHVLMHGKHCHYCRAVDEDGESCFGKLIIEHIEKARQS